MSKANLNTAVERFAAAASRHQRLKRRYDDAPAARRTGPIEDEYLAAFDAFEAAKAQLFDARRARCKELEDEIPRDEIRAQELAQREADLARELAAVQQQQQQQQQHRDAECRRAEYARLTREVDT